MHILISFLYVFEVIVCLLLAGVVMLQKPKDGGLNTAIGGGMGESMFGAQMGNVLTKTTVILGAIFIINTLVLSRLTANRSSSVMEDVKSPAPISQQAMPRPAAPAPAPAAPVKAAPAKPVTAPAKPAASVPAPKKPAAAPAKPVAPAAKPAAAPAPAKKPAAPAPAAK